MTCYGEKETESIHTMPWCGVELYDNSPTMKCGKVRHSKGAIVAKKDNTNGTENAILAVVCRPLCPSKVVGFRTNSSTIHEELGESPEKKE
ncbi:hypothetical protein DICVIV_05275 [Dictyocaulus viviparus]|uniref:Uncharacterized protein n=1 Tax=Dictyocaulus viviparus TaxID=29172 RepID=A0A0D8XVC3_DICVI|nr:hypothetical protein DICVIV_05275 [Dictyocaulus viviparus]